MIAEINSDSIHQDDMLRNLVSERLHYAMSRQPSSTFDKQPMNAPQRILTLFLELSDRQFRLMTITSKWPFAQPPNSPDNQTFT